MKTFLVLALLTMRTIIGNGQTEFHDLPSFDVTAEPRGRGEDHSSGGDYSGGQGKIGSKSPTKPQAATERKTAVTINNVTYSVTLDTERRLSEFLHKYVDGNVGEIAANVAAGFSLFELLGLNTKAVAFDPLIKIVTFGTDDIIVRQSDHSSLEDLFRWDLRTGNSNRFENVLEFA